MAGLLRVKTGSLGTVTSMAGNVSRTNGERCRLPWWSTILRDYAAARSAIDSFITKLAGCKDPSKGHQRLATKAVNVHKRTSAYKPEKGGEYMAYSARLRARP